MDPAAYPAEPAGDQTKEKNQTKPFLLMSFFFFSIQFSSLLFFHLRSKTLWTTRMSSVP